MIIYVIVDFVISYHAFCQCSITLHQDSNHVTARLCQGRSRASAGREPARSHVSKRFSHGHHQIHLPNARDTKDIMA